ncbi:MAG: hypothetical protein KAW61_08440, partial [candidate division Zixibacteria bacterium]|nr:hypothetical protein [candidate division Zixibacteria bacterium]
VLVYRVCRFILWCRVSLPDTSLQTRESRQAETPDGTGTAFVDQVGARGRTPGTVYTLHFVG